MTDPQVTELVVAARPTAVIAAATTWEEFPQLWRELLDEVWRTVRASPGVAAGRNVMLYRDDVPHVEVGVEVAEPFAGSGRVVGSSLPAGRVVAATHRGPYEELGRGHRAVARACAELGLRRWGRAGTSTVTSPLRRSHGRSRSITSWIDRGGSRTAR
jgi:effector-binding domain-containing protein